MIRDSLGEFPERELLWPFLHVERKMLEGRLMAVGAVLGVVLALLPGAYADDNIFPCEDTCGEYFSTPCDLFFKQDASIAALPKFPPRVSMSGARAPPPPRARARRTRITSA